MNKVKLLLSASAAVVAFGLVACGDDSSSGPDQESFIGESSDSGACESSSGDVAASSGSVESSSSQIAAISSSQNGPNTSSQTATLSGDVESSSSQQNSGCGESAKWLETCFEQPVDDYGEMSNCAAHGESENCIPQFSCSSDMEGMYGTGCRDKGVYVCDRGEWALTNCALPVLSSSSSVGAATSSSQTVVSSSGTEHYWWQEACSVEGEQKSEDFGGVTDTYECVQGEWKIINKQFPDCAPDMDCAVEDWQNACKTNGVVGTACVVDEVDYGHKSIDGCDYFCYDGKWEYLVPPAE